jgi:hypothetical protein
MAENLKVTFLKSEFRVNSEFLREIPIPLFKPRNVQKFINLKCSTLLINSPVALFSHGIPHP